MGSGALLPNSFWCPWSSKLVAEALVELLNLVSKLRGDEAAREVQHLIQYFPEPPFESDLQVPTKCEITFLARATSSGNFTSFHGETNGLSSTGHRQAR